MDQKPCVVFVSVPDTTTAEDIAEALILRKLAAYVNIVPEMTTIRASKKHITKKKLASLLIIKTQESKLEKLTSFMKLNTPGEDTKLDVTAVNVCGGSLEFVQWMGEKMSTDDD